MSLAKLSATLGLLALACAGPHPDADEVEDGFAVEDGKEDNFLSISARELIVEGRARVTLPADASEDDVRKLVSLKQISIAWFLNQYLVDKEASESNAQYGGFGAMAKASSYAELGITKLDPTTWEFRFAQLIAGKNNILRRLPLDSTGTLSLEIGKPSNEELARLETNQEWYRQAPWSAWDPAKALPEQKETLRLTFREERRSSDAWWDYKSLFADGKLDIDAYFGWDYHDAYHLKHSRAFYGWLLARGFRSPVSDFDRLTRRSGPLTKTISADGRSVKVEVRILYGKPGTETDPDTDEGGKVLEDEMRASLKTRDVVIYSGHSGPFYGFALANWKKTDEGDFDDSEMLTAELASKYQIIVAEGCDTYQIGPAFLGNPAKQGKNVDVITTTTFSDASSPATVQHFVSRLLEIDTQGRHRPRTLKSLLEDFEASAGWSSPLYGIHGIDDDPKLHPYARPDRFCGRCSSNSDCGGTGNACITMGDSGRRCTAACTDDSGCPSGYACRKVASASTSTIYASMCVPAGNVCR
jgi:hypothetical protein